MQKLLLSLHLRVCVHLVPNRNKGPLENSTAKIRTQGHHSWTNTHGHQIPKRIFDLPKKKHKEISRPRGHPSTWGKQKGLTLDVEHLPTDRMLAAAAGEWPWIRFYLIFGRQGICLPTTSGTAYSSNRSAASLGWRIVRLLGLFCTLSLTSADCSHNCLLLHQKWLKVIIEDRGAESRKLLSHKICIRHCSTAPLCNLIHISPEMGVWLNILL